MAVLSEDPRSAEPAVWWAPRKGLLPAAPSRPGSARRPQPRPRWGRRLGRPPQPPSRGRPAASPAPHLASPPGPAAPSRLGPPTSCRRGPDSRPRPLSPTPCRSERAGGRAALPQRTRRRLHLSDGEGGGAGGKARGNRSRGPTQPGRTSQLPRPETPSGPGAPLGEVPARPLARCCCLRPRGSSGLPRPSGGGGRRPGRSSGTGRTRGWGPAGSPSREDRPRGCWPPERRWAGSACLVVRGFRLGSWGKILARLIFPAHRCAHPCSALYPAPFLPHLIFHGKRNRVWPSMGLSSGCHWSQPPFLWGAPIFFNQGLTGPGLGPSPWHMVGQLPHFTWNRVR